MYYLKANIHSIPNHIQICTQPTYCKMAPNIEYQVSKHQKLAVFGPFGELNPKQHYHNGIRSGRMTYHLKAQLFWHQYWGKYWGKMFGLNLFQCCGTTLYIIEWTVSYVKYMTCQLLTSFQGLFASETVSTNRTLNRRKVMF